MKYVFPLLFVCIGLKAQNMVGEVEYRYRIFYDKIYASETYISKQEKDRIMLSWKNPDGWSTRMKLQFWPEKSLYTYGEPYELRSYSWRQDDYFVANNLKESSFLKYMDGMGKSYIVRDSLKAPKWKILNEIKEIQGHMCMNAVTEDTLKGQKIMAWFAVDIPVSTGPEEFFGLPGLILGYEVNDDMLVVEAEKIVFGEPSEVIKLPKKLKGKEVSGTEYHQVKKEFMESCHKSERPWAWAIRY